MTNDNPVCLFCGGKTQITQRRTGKDFTPSPDHEGSLKFYHGKITTRYRFQILCNKCKARGPLAKTKEEALNAYRPHSN